MRKPVTGLYLLGIALLLGSCSPPQRRTPAPPDAAVHSYFEHVRQLYSGGRALAIVAFVEQYWRLPGNTGFDASIGRVATVLDSAGYLPEDKARGSRLTYRIERRPMARPTWEPVDASVTIVGQDSALLRFASNRNMLAIYSYSTPAEGVEAEVVDVGKGRPQDYQGLDLHGRIVFGEASAGRLFREAVQKRGALGVLAYRMPAYTQPQRYRHSIQFGRIPYDPDRRAWGILLSYAARQRLKNALASGPVRVRVMTKSRIYSADELTLVADVRGSRVPEERFVFSAHVQEPGANDNASGVAALAEMARVLAQLVRTGSLDPQRTITFIWGNEVASTRRYIQEDSTRAAGIRWGMSLDMVGENTQKTGGTFLIEKMPDPSAVWTRGEDRHTEWGGRPLAEKDLTPHYFNDLVRYICLQQAAATGWIVRTNPFEGGSDHVPFLRAGKPAVLLWHFTDAFYHTDADRLDKVSPQTLENVGISALVTALTLTSASSRTARLLIAELERAALQRLEVEWQLSRDAIAAGSDRNQQIHVLQAWIDWYQKAIRSTEDIEVGGASPETLRTIEAAARHVAEAGQEYVQRLRST